MGWVARRGHSRAAPVFRVDRGERGIAAELRENARMPIRSARASATLAVSFVSVALARAVDPPAVSEPRASDERPAASASPAPTPTPTSDYATRTMRGWTVRIHPALLAEEALCAAVLEELDHQLYAIVRAVPAPALERLREIPIWAELETPKTACMCYHVSRDWLVPNGYNADKERSVEIGNARAFLEWTRAQPWMVLHELAHGYHDREFGYDDAAIIAAWRRMGATGRYEEVAHISGTPRRHYALVNQMEWFAETTEALFGTNDFHPFVRSELRETDPEGAALVERLWREPPARSERNAGADEGAGVGADEGEHGRGN
ncbi:MAG: hypothetical protein RI967_623 [Planctomycetota bacterium]